MTVIHLIRHGDVHNPDEIYYGRIPNFRLSEKGRGQAKSAGQFIKSKPVTALFASPQQRTQETAKIIAEQIGEIDIITDERLNEVYTPHDGMTMEALIARNFDLYTGNQPPYELAQDIQNRAVDFLNDIREKYPKQHVIGISHGDILTFSLMYAKQVGIDMEAKGNLEALGITDEYPATASILSFSFEDDNQTIPTVTYTRPY